ncbi:GNAT family N-acetyltransferase [Desulfuribacillus stibiiarsenatis]|uniref:GNAT family N-acetyltransferase n=1 Tax=Desulfuribacillus stibiiarsenatis TaxID=1390249 RepID=A0A1E5L664_9FIRM|nr:GNAT family protein [Desulfuribacillus stibiiarsenatis]OEH85493.1 GNAT family N-acetyltransferase [Desulfuribacillus stibiiarsenatis]
MNSRIFIKGQDVYLRHLQLTDIEGNYLHWFDNEIVCKYNEHHRYPYYSEQLESYIKNLAGNHNNLVFAIITNEENEHVGNISIQNICYINRSAEIAIIVGERKYWGKGHSSEAMQLIISHAFYTLNLHRLYCGTHSQNVGMIKLAHKLGFQQEGIRRKAIYKNGDYSDIIEFGLLKDEYNGL